MGGSSWSVNQIIVPGPVHVLAVTGEHVHHGGVDQVPGLAGLREPGGKCIKSDPTSIQYFFQVLERADAENIINSDALISRLAMPMVDKEDKQGSDPKEDIICGICRSSSLLFLVALKALAVFSFLGVGVGAEDWASCLSISIILEALVVEETMGTTGLNQGGSLSLAMLWSSFGALDISACFFSLE